MTGYRAIDRSFISRRIEAIAPLQLGFEAYTLACQPTAQADSHRTSIYRASGLAAIRKFDLKLGNESVSQTGIVAAARPFSPLARAQRGPARTGAFPGKQRAREGAQR
jgi:hypothetical protein